MVDFTRYIIRSFTEYLGLILPGYTDPALIEDINDNFSDLDVKIRNTDLLLALLRDDFESLKAALTSGVTANPFSLTFENLDGLDVTGTWNKAQMRVEV